MTLEQAIEFCLHMEEEQYESAHNTIIGDYPAYEAAPHFRLASEYKQIAEWLIQLKKSKQLLKTAVDDINFYVDCCDTHCDECCCDPDNHCRWKHEAEVLALIGGNEGDVR